MENFEQKRYSWGFILSGIAMSGIVLVMLFSVLFPADVLGQEGDGGGDEIGQPGICGLPSKNIYAKKNMSLEDAMEKYHDEMNKQFNTFIAKMLAGQKQAIELGEPDKNNNPPANGVCDANNYSTWCAAQTLLENGSYGYMEYFQSLSCRRTQVFDTPEEEYAFIGVLKAPSSLGAGLSSSTGDAFLTEENEAGFHETLQATKALEINARVDAIDREIYAAKQTLDTTLAAYEELKTAWPMHKQYRTIYGSLLKYRDKMVNIRHQVEAFPNEFIDATTTQCT